MECANIRGVSFPIRNLLSDTYNYEGENSNIQTDFVTYESSTYLEEKLETLSDCNSPHDIINMIRHCIVPRGIINTIEIQYLTGVANTLLKAEKRTFHAR